MCWAKKCCFFFELDVGCVVIAVGSLVWSLAACAAAAVALCGGVGAGAGAAGGAGAARRGELCGALALAALLALAAALLLAGVLRRSAALLVAYFALGLAFTMGCALAALLLLLAERWQPALLLAALAGVYTHSLVVAHSLYEAGQRGGRKLRARAPAEPRLLDHAAPVAVCAPPAPAAPAPPSNSTLLRGRDLY